MRSPTAVSARRPAAPGFAALTIADGSFRAATRCARLRRAYDRRRVWEGGTHGELAESVQ
ncbi:hypothetical protein BST37_17195 [Mycobacterium noviomagense]|uniref:Uncharacterized protein n=1 Tax=Mycobacterium noviomagense TaxID=459858 RepID=A0ABX3T1G5_9MYCO|nr:hypothetical protein BST37_17195 [Mycobacterium noviomagense]